MHSDSFANCLVVTKTTEKQTIGGGNFPRPWDWGGVGVAHLIDKLHRQCQWLGLSATFAWAKDWDPSPPTTQKGP
eukprot:3492163-Amphidinium_carterae.1